jgi:hypothetical protein
MAARVSDAEIGKGRPPKASQFKPGQSGNSRGRKKGRKNFRSIVHALAHEEQLVREGDQQVKMHTWELIFKVLHRRALKGDLEAKKLLDKYRDVYAVPEVDKNAPMGNVAPGAATIEEFERTCAAARKQLEWVYKEREREEREHQKSRSLSGAISEPLEKP